MLHCISETFYDYCIKPYTQDDMRSWCSLLLAIRMWSFQFDSDFYDCEKNSHQIKLWLKRFIAHCSAVFLMQVRLCIKGSYIMIMQ